MRSDVIWSDVIWVCLEMEWHLCMAFSGNCLGNMIIDHWEILGFPIFRPTHNVGGRACYKATIIQIMCLQVVYWFSLQKPIPKVHQSPKVQGGFRAAALRKDESGPSAEDSNGGKVFPQIWRVSACGGFHSHGATPKTLDGSQGTIPLTWIIWGYLHFRKPSCSFAWKEATSKSGGSSSFSRLKVYSFWGCKSCFKQTRCLRWEPPMPHGIGILLSP